MASSEVVAVSSEEVKIAMLDIPGWEANMEAAVDWAKISTAEGREASDWDVCSGAIVEVPGAPKVSNP